VPDGRVGRHEHAGLPRRPGCCGGPAWVTTLTRHRLGAIESASTLRTGGPRAVGARRRRRRARPAAGHPCARADRLPGRAYAREYVDFVAAVRAADRRRAGETRLGEAVRATSSSSWPQDEYEVARLHLKTDRDGGALAEESGGGARAVQPAPRCCVRWNDAQRSSSAPGSTARSACCAPEAPARHPAQSLRPRRRAPCRARAAREYRALVERALGRPLARDVRARRDAGRGCPTSSALRGHQCRARRALRAEQPT